MRRTVIVVFAALAGLGAASLPARAAVSASVCYSVSVTANGQNVAQADCVQQTAP